MVAHNRGERPILIISGPTATGKTAVAVQSALDIGGEIVCADSMQIYQGLDIGTAKPAAEEMKGVPHHLFSFADPSESFSLVRYLDKARMQARLIQGRGNAPILCGGTGLYISAFINETVFEKSSVDFDLRRSLYDRIEKEGIQVLIDEIEKIDVFHAKSLNPKDHKRIVRAVELLRTTGRTRSYTDESVFLDGREWFCYFAVLYMEDRQKLYQKIEDRIEQMLSAGLLGEAYAVYENQARYQTAVQAIGYKEFFDYFKGISTLQTCVDKLKQATRNYAKRQMTWFRKQKDTVWYNVEGRTPDSVAEQVVVDYKQHKRSRT